MNRIWQQYFGCGLVETSNDFGTQGSRPTHPELLDWLAAKLIEKRWSLKAVHRLIVTSATYRQTSHARPELSEIDSQNKLLARQSRLRLEAEIVRDVALQASGLLSRKIGGPSVFPPQPEGVMELTIRPQAWEVSPGEDRYRRGMYTHFWRSTPHPMLRVFDAPEGTTTCTRRDRANTPLQALTLLNDEAFVEAAIHLARRVLRDCRDSSTSDKLRYAFRLCLAREPTEEEHASLSRLLAAGISHSEEVRATSSKLPPAYAASPEEFPWINVARALLNLDETITRE